MMKQMKRVVAMLLALLLIVAGCYTASWEGENVYASDTTGVYEIVETTNTTDADLDGIPEKEGYLFAGWYQDTDCTLETAVKTAAESTYVKFVKEDILSVKMQISNSEIKDGDKTAYRAIRLISSVDSLVYSEVGFIVNIQTQ